MTWYQIGDKPLSQTMMSQFINAYVDGLVQERRNSSALAIE